MAEENPKKSLRDFYKKSVAADERYFDSLGRFISRYTRAEMAVQLVLWHYAKTSHNIARALLSGLRGDDVRNRLGRMLDGGALSQEDWDAVSPSLLQFNLITDMRNKVVHSGEIEQEDGSRIVSNAFKALREDDIVDQPISAEILDEMRGDLRKIMVDLLVNHMGRAKPAGAENQAWIDEVLAAPWQYKPAPVSHRTPEANRRKRQTPSSPKKASRS